jgi:hypothetical protein
MSVNSKKYFARASIPKVLCCFNEKFSEKRIITIDFLPKIVEGIETVRYLGCLEADSGYRIPDTG